MYDLLEISEESAEGVFIVKLVVEEVHLLDVMKLNEQLQNLIQSNNMTRMILDLSYVHVMTSAAIGMLLNINRKIKSGLRLSSPSMGVQRVFEFTSISAIIPVFNTVTDALNSYQ